jgi:hypothetical protein
MNERIKELARRVVGKHRNDVSSISLFDEQIEKFAELIVRECSGIVQNYMSRWPEDHELTKQIKEHFGVVEE